MLVLKLDAKQRWNMPSKHYDLQTGCLPKNWSGWRDLQKEAERLLLRFVEKH